VYAQFGLNYYQTYGSKGQFFSFICDEVITFDNQNWISIHGDMVENWRRVSLLLNLQMVTKRGESNNFTIMLMNLVHIFLGLSNGDLAFKLVCFGVDGVILFFSLKIGVRVVQTCPICHWHPLHGT